MFLVGADEHRLTGIIADLCRDFRKLTDKRSLLYIDDVDLLDTGPAVDQTQVTALVRRLEALAEGDDIAVLASLRTRHLGVFNKEFIELLRVEPLEDEDVKLVYHKQIEILNKGKPIFSDECLDELVQATSGHIGTFLRWCFRFHTWGKRRLYQAKETRLLDERDLFDHVRDQVGELSSRHDLIQHIDRIRSAVLSDRVSVELEPNVLGTELIHTLLEEPASVGAGLFLINPLFARVLRKAAEPAA
jgi:hypothetical protein